MYTIQDVGNRLVTKHIDQLTDLEIAKEWLRLQGLSGQELPGDISLIVQLMKNKYKGKYLSVEVEIPVQEKQLIVDEWNAKEAYEASPEKKADDAQKLLDKLGPYQKLLLDVILDQENRIRVLENKNTITIQQLKTALKANLQQYL